jgi:hypothetical protein
MSDQLQMFEEQTSQASTSSLLEVLAKISHWQENELGWKDKGVLLSSKQLGSFTSADLVYLSGKMSREHSPQTMAQTFGQLSKPLPTLGAIDLNGNCLIQVGYYPKIESGFTLSDILQPPNEIGEEYFLSQKDRGATNELPDKQKANYNHTRYTADPNGSFIGEHEQSSQEVKQVGTKLDSNGGTQPYQQDRVYDADGIVPALNQAKSDLILRIKTANQKGYRSRGR